MKVNIGKYVKTKNRQKVSVVIEPHDTYSLDYTLAYIILPALLQLKATQHGIPAEFADNGSGSESQDSFDFYKDTHEESFNKNVQKWQDILDKMIWSFEQILHGDYDEKYHHGEIKYDWVKTDDQLTNPLTGKLEDMYEMVDRNPEKHWLDYEGLKEHEKRIQEGLELFGKYYRSLWD